jgi:tetratricopeptide (TPR) repeat protein
MLDNVNFLKFSEKLVKQYEANKQHYFKLDEFIAITDYYAAKNNYKKAIEVNNVAELFYPSSSELKTIEADLYIRNDEFAKAEKVIKSIEHNSDVFVDVCILKGEIYIKKQKHSTAEKQFEKAIEASDAKDYTIELICDFLLSMHEMQLAKKYLELSQKIIPNTNPTLMYWLARCYLCESDYEKAVTIYESLTDIEPFDENAWENLGETYMNLNRYEDAIKAFDLRLSISGKYQRSILINKAECFSLLGKNSEAIKIYNKVLDFSRDDTDAKYGIAKCYEREGMDDVAEKLYFDILAEAPDYSDVYYSLANMYSQKNDFSTAKKFMLEAMNNVEIAPAFLIKMIKVLVEQDKINEAQQAIEKFINDKTYEHDCEAWLLYAEIIAYNNLEKAIEILERKYTQNFYAVGEICYHLAYYYFLSENISQCIKYLEHGLELEDSMITQFFELAPEALLNTQILDIYLSYKAKKI